MSSKKSHHVGASLGGVAEAEPHDHEHDYSGLLAGIRASFDAATKSGAKLFTTDAADLNELYLDSLPSHRQVHNCHACRRFLEQFGGLVTIDPKTGVTRSVMFNPADAPAFYASAFGGLAIDVENSQVTGVFAHQNIVWGTPTTGDWRHMSVLAQRKLLNEVPGKTPFQVTAAKAEDFKNVTRALSERSMSKVNLDQAIAIFEGQAVDRASKYVSPLKWLRELHDRPKGSHGDNVLWAAVASAPDGFCHPRSSVIGPLLLDIDNGLPFRDIKTKFNAMVDSRVHGRPQAAPSAGNIAQAEKLIAQLGLTKSLERRHALLEEILPAALWTPPKKRAAPKAGGLFSGIKPKKTAKTTAPGLALPARKITWEKFAETVLPGAEKLEVQLLSVVRMLALTTAVHPSAPPIIKWDHADERNPYSWYVYPTPRTALDWGLNPGWHNVVQVTTLPTTWGSRPMPEIFDGAVLMVEHARDRNSPGLALFPEVLKGELREVRATIEAFSNKGKLETPAGQLAIGVDLRKGTGDIDVNVRVTTKTGVAEFQIDRWE